MTRNNLWNWGIAYFVFMMFVGPVTFAAYSTWVNPPPDYKEQISVRLASLERDQQALIAGIQYEEKRRNKIISIRNFVISVNPNIDIGLAYQIAELNYDLAEKYQIDVNLAVAIQAVESHFNFNAVSPAGAMGIFQLMPVNYRSICRMKGWEYSKDKIKNKKWLSKQIESGFIYLTLLESEYDNLEELLCIWNSGGSQLRIWRENPEAIFDETKNFIQQVTLQLEELG